MAEASEERRSKFKDQDWLLGRTFKGKIVLLEWVGGQVARVKADRWTVTSIDKGKARLEAEGAVAIMDIQVHKLAEAPLEET